ncbi:MAG: glycosyltransferase family 2 protein [Ginsengibacter sp.]
MKLPQSVSISNLVSICIPTFNGAKYLHKCLESAIAQTYPDLEILISDDLSTDATLDIANKYSTKNENIRVIKNGSKQGMVANWNHCIHEARGGWIKFLFQDDFLEPDCVAKMMEGCLANDCEIAVCRRDFQIESGTPDAVTEFFKNGVTKSETLFTETRYYSPGQTAGIIKHHLLNNIIGEPTCFLFSKKIVGEYGDFNIQLRQLVDYEFILRCILNNGFVFLHQKYATFRVHGSSQTSSNYSINKIRSERGDRIIMLSEFISGISYESLKHSLGEAHLKLYLKYTYFKSCKLYGEKKFRSAIADILEVYPDTGRLKYSFAKYLAAKLKFKWSSLFI